MKVRITADVTPRSRDGYIADVHDVASVLRGELGGLDYDDKDTGVSFVMGDPEIEVTE